MSEQHTNANTNIASKKKVSQKTIGIVVVILAIIAGIAGFIVHQQKQAAKREITYQEACSYEAAGNYNAAIKLFQELDGYSDSEERLANVQFAYDLLNSDAYAETQVALIFMKSLGYSYDISYSYNDRQVIMLLYTTIGDMAQNGIRKQWDKHCELVNSLTKSSVDALSDAGFTVDCKCTMILSDEKYEHKDDVLFSSLNGKTTFDFWE